MILSGSVRGAEVYGRPDPRITRVTERLTHAFNDEKAHLVDYQQ
jgi:hypothetical protein